MKYQLHKDTVKQLLDIRKDKRIALEGNILKVLDTSGDVEFESYIKEAVASDKSKQRQRLDITKKIQKQNKELMDAQVENERIQEQLRQTLIKVDTARHKALNDLDVLQKRTQFQLVQTIVKIALGIIIGVGIMTTILYVLSMIMGVDTQLIGTAWSNMFGILLTNAFSIIGTIMGVKYASNTKSENE